MACDTDDREGESPSPMEPRLGRMFHSSATGRRREQTLPEALGLRQALHPRDDTAESAGSGRSTRTRAAGGRGAVPPSGVVNRTRAQSRETLGESVSLVAVGFCVGSQSFSVAQRRAVSRTRSIAADWLWADQTIDHLSRTSGWTILRATTSGAAWTA